MMSLEFLFLFWHYSDLKKTLVLYMPITDTLSTTNIRLQILLPAYIEHVLFSLFPEYLLMFLVFLFLFWQYLVLKHKHLE